MGIEIERKFLVSSDQWRREICDQFEIVQGYISTTPDHTIRVRLRDETAILTIKGRPRGLVRREFEYEIPPREATILLDEFCRDRVLEKTRFHVRQGEHLWEIDVFRGPNEGLVVAEIELARPDEEFDIPPWIGDEITGQARYYNARLVERPFESWDHDPTGQE